VDGCAVEGAAVAVTFLVIATAQYLSLPSNQRSLQAAASSAASTIRNFFHKSDNNSKPSATPAPAAPVGATPTPTTTPAAPTGTAVPTTASPAVPTGLVGTQDGKGGRAGGRVNSGPLAPEHGGTGNAAKDFDHLTGGKSGPAPDGSRLPPGTQVGENGTQLRPPTGTSGPRIDIPANGPKPVETLHYPR
jgi:hypothetical protein